MSKVINEALKFLKEAFLRKISIEDGNVTIIDLIKVDNTLRLEAYSSFNEMNFNSFSKEEQDNDEILNELKMYVTEIKEENENLLINYIYNSSEELFSKDNYSLRDIIKGKIDLTEPIIFYMN